MLEEPLAVVSSLLNIPSGPVVERAVALCS